MTSRWCFSVLCQATCGGLSNGSAHNASSDDDPSCETAWVVGSLDVLVVAVAMSLAVVEGFWLPRPSLWRGTSAISRRRLVTPRVHVDAVPDGVVASRIQERPSMPALGKNVCISLS